MPYDIHRITQRKVGLVLCCCVLACVMHPVVAYADDFACESSELGTVACTATATSLSVPGGGALDIGSAQGSRDWGAEGPAGEGVDASADNQQCDRGTAESDVESGNVEPGLAGGADAAQSPDAPAVAETASENASASSPAVSLDQTHAAGLVADQQGLKYLFADGTECRESFQEVDGKSYYFASDGYAVAGLWEMGGRRYLFDENTCVQQFGWHVWDDGSRSYFVESRKGAAAMGWWTLSGRRYYFDQGACRTLRGVQNVSGRLYRFASDGSVVTGWYSWGDGARSYFAKDLKGAAGLGKWTIAGDVYYFAGDLRKAVSGWHMWSDGTRSYFVKGLKFAAATGSRTIGGSLYYFNPSTKKNVIGWMTWSDGKRSYFAKGLDGAAGRGWWSLGGKRYYFSKETAKTYKGRWRIDGTTYYFSSDGSRYTGWVFWNSGGMSYFDSKGAMATGTRKLHGVTVRFGSSGKASTGDPRITMAARAQKYTSSTGNLVMVDTKHNRVGVFVRGSSGWVLSKYWRCSTGSLGVHQTPSGTYKVGYRGYVFGHGYSCYYYTQIHHGVLFHSITYFEGTKTPLDSRLGKNISNGCVRLAIDKAKWIHDNIARNTTVRVYRA